MNATPKPLAAAGFWRRYAAWTLDATIVGLPALLLLLVRWPDTALRMRAALQALLGVLTASLDAAVRNGEDILTLATRLSTQSQVAAPITAFTDAVQQWLLPPLLCFVLLAALWWIGFEASARQATPGKRLLGLHVVRLDGSAPGLVQAALRHIAGTLSWLLLNLGHAIAAWRPDKRALHDLLAGTRVVFSGVPEKRLPPWAQAWLWLQALVCLLATVAWLRWVFGTMQAAVDNALLG